MEDTKDPYVPIDYDEDEGVAEDSPNMREYQLVVSCVNGDSVRSSILHRNDGGDSLERVIDQVAATKGISFPVPNGIAYVPSEQVSFIILIGVER